MASDSKTPSLNQLIDKCCGMWKENLITCFKQLETDLKTKYPDADCSKAFTELFQKCGFDQAMVASVASKTATAKRTTKKKDPNRVNCNAEVKHSKNGNKTCSRGAVVNGKCKAHAEKANGGPTKTKQVASKKEADEESVDAEVPVSDDEN